MRIRQLLVFIKEHLLFPRKMVINIYHCKYGFTYSVKINVCIEKGRFSSLAWREEEVTSQLCWAEAPEGHISGSLDREV